MATQQGADQQQQEQITDIDPIELIAQQVEASREADRATSGNDDGKQQEQQAQGKDDALDQQIEASLIDEPGKYVVRVKEEGVEREIPLTEALASYQKGSVASRRLMDATNKLREADEILAKAKQGGAGDEIEKAQSELDNATQSEEVARKAVDALLEGDPEEAAKHLASLGRTDNSSTHKGDTESVAAEVKRQIDVESALTKFSEDYDDVASDPYLADMANRNLRQIIEEKKASGEAVDFGDALREAGDMTRDWLKSKGVGSATEQSSTTENERLARKEGLDQVKPLNAGVGSEIEPEESALDVVNQMRKDRGITT